jgi:hypothetical protein
VPPLFIAPGNPFEDGFDFELINETNRLAMGLVLGFSLGWRIK